MWPFSKKKFASQAIAYLKALVPEGEPGPVVLIPPEESPVVTPFIDRLVTTYLVDAGKKFEYVQHRHLTGEGLTPETLHTLALKNLAQVANTRLEVKAYRSFFGVNVGGNFEASLLLLDALWEGPFRQYVKGEYAVGIPARDMLSFCDLTDEAGVTDLRSLVAQVYANGDHVLLDDVLVRRGGDWVGLPRTA